ncbi:Phosphate-selective porin O and P [Symmachiella macrocystis]|uniref:Phosphate-selective porin O and P n=1 Tax=Symmachiella macrocystis TaxID=2527985 RepID=A0A5C6BAC6_9PLAN|nr:porin [Symmachiella macrocystis]TWU09043.1 Phosphate-selective porin O and P [Symmachiella macrocystis]
MKHIFLALISVITSAILLVAIPASVLADEPVDVDALLRRLEEAERRLKILETGTQREFADAARVGRTNAVDPTFAVDVDNARTSAIDPTIEVEPAAFSVEYNAYSAATSQGEYARQSTLPRASAFEINYDSGFVIRPDDKDAQPYQLQVNGRMQIRHVGFDRDANFYSNRGDTFRGGPLPINNRNDFEIERARLVFSGFVHDPKLEFFLNIDGDSDDNHDAIFHDFWFNYEFSKTFDLYFGKAFVPGSRAWVDGSSRTHFADRSMATTFFRPDRSVGVWAIGEVAEDLFYRIMLANGFNASDFRFSELDTNLAYSGTMWWDVEGDYGKGYADLEWHEDLAVLVGHSFTYASQQGVDSLGLPKSEQNFLRISDGTRLIAPDALAPGVTVVGGDIYLYAVDAAFKYRGWSVNSELYFRWLNQFKTLGGPIPYSQLYAAGFYTDAGYMILERSLEVIGRTSLVDGMFGTRWEYAAGVNWYVNGTHQNKVTFDITKLDGSPVSNSGPNYEVGQEGLLTRLQWQIAF